MNRREFVIQGSLALLGLYLGVGRSESRNASPASSPFTMAFLADAHLKDGRPHRPEARALAKAVAEIRELRAKPDLVLFAGDLAHDGHPGALGLGEEILSDLGVPILAVPGEGDFLRHSRPFPGRFWGPAPFHYRLQGLNLVGLSAACRKGPEGLVFFLGPEQRKWLLGLLARLEPEVPLLVLCHAPLVPVFRPWGQWLAEEKQVLQALRPFARVFWCHGHGHCHGASGTLFYSGRVGPVHQLSLPATSWPYPEPAMGTPTALQPGLGPKGCGWVSLARSGPGFILDPVIWQA